jgi:hypothetical protein
MSCAAANIQSRLSRGTLTQRRRSEEAQAWVLLSALSFSGGKGAAIGAVIGAGAGAGVQAISKASQVQLPAKSTLSFRLETPLTVIPSSTLLKSAERRLGTVRRGVGDGLG